jgi:hypothetical protein
MCKGQHVWCLWGSFCMCMCPGFTLAKAVVVLARPTNITSLAGLMEQLGCDCSTLHMFKTQDNSQVKGKFRLISLLLQRRATPPLLSLTIVQMDSPSVIVQMDSRSLSQIVRMDFLSRSLRLCKWTLSSLRLCEWTLLSQIVQTNCSIKLLEDAHL